jgi:hypothetical protein
MYEIGMSHLRRDTSLPVEAFNGVEMNGQPGVQYFDCHSLAGFLDSGIKDPTHCTGTEFAYDLVLFVQDVPDRRECSGKWDKEVSVLRTSVEASKLPPTVAAETGVHAVDSVPG